MPLTPSELLDLHDAIGPHLLAVKRLFKPGAVLTLAVWLPEREKAGEDTGVVIGDGDLGQAVEVIRRAQRAEPCR